MNRRVALYGWLSSEAVSLTGTRVSMIAIPWFVLTTTGSATQTGLVAFAEMAPYVLAKAASGPWVDRIGARRICVGADLLSVLSVGAIPLLHGLGMLSFPVLLVLVALAGTLRGPSDGARHSLVPAIVAASDVPMERATGLAGAIERLASTVGAAFAGVLVPASARPRRSSSTPRASRCPRPSSRPRPLVRSAGSSRSNRPATSPSSPRAGTSCGGTRCSLRWSR